MFLLAGLGNPGASYRSHRHNIGCLAVEEIARVHGLHPAGAKFSALCHKGRIGPHDVFAIRPQTYMNRSGQSVGEAMRFYKLDPAQVIVIHDELDLENGRLKAKRGGGNGGHNGLRDIDRAIGPDYWRIRLGIGHPGRKEMVTGHVLSDFSTDEGIAQDRLIAAVARELTLLLEGDDARFMNAVALAAGN